MSVHAEQGKFMYKVLNVSTDLVHCGNIGHVVEDFSLACRLAKKFGFDGVNLDAAYILNTPTESIEEDLAVNQLKPAAFGIPFDFLASSDTEFKKGVETFAKIAPLARQLNCLTAICYLPPWSNEMNFNHLFARTVKRVAYVKPILVAHNLKIGFEFSGPTEFRLHSKYDFIHTIDGIRALISAADIYGYGGFKFDSHHWYSSGASLLDVQHMDPSYFLYIELNDGLKGYDIHTIPEMQRELPLTTHTTDNIGLLRELIKKGYDGPVALEPWNEAIRQLPLEDAIQTVKTSLDECFSLAKSAGIA